MARKLCSHLLPASASMVAITLIGMALMMGSALGADNESRSTNGESGSTNGPVLGTAEGTSEADREPTLELRVDGSPSDQPLELDESIDEVSKSPAAEDVTGTLEETTTSEKTTIKRFESAEAVIEPQPLSPQMVELREQVQNCLDEFYRRPIHAASYSPWTVMHRLLPYGVDAQLIVGERKVNSIGWLCLEPASARTTTVTYLANSCACLDRHWRTRTSGAVPGCAGTKPSSGELWY